MSVLKKTFLHIACLHRFVRDAQSCALHVSFDAMTQFQT